MTKAYAVLVDGEIDIATVSPTATAAMVNHIWNLGVTVTNEWPDEAIAEAFSLIGKGKLVAVNVTVDEDTKG